MKKVNYKFLTLLLGMCIAFGACQKTFLDVNNDPNRVTDENITPDLLFTQAATELGIRMVGGQAGSEGAKTDYQFAQNWIGYMCNSGDYAIDQQETSYNIDFAFADLAWQRDYANLFHLYLTKTKALAAGNDVLAGAAMILSADIFQQLVDSYGDLPYSQAFQTQIYKHPAYDKAQDVYNALQLVLDSAITYMNEDAPASFATTDVVNHGDQTKWIKFANTLKLRLLIRQSEVPGFSPSAEISKIEANGGVLDAGETVSVNPGYSDAQYKQSPFWGNYGYTVNGNIAQPGYRANNYILNILLPTGDDRVTRFFLDVGGNYVGGDYGSPANPTGAQASYFGPGLNVSAGQDQWIYPSYESMFLKAEAIARGWMEGDAQAELNAAITESFVWLGVPDAEADAASYIENNPEITDLSNAGESPDDKARFIAFQKYIANTCIDPKESWADQRRLNFLPDGYISVNPNRVSQTLPLRLLYPQSEYTTNAESVQALGDINAFTTKIFWEP